MINPKSILKALKIIGQYGPAVIDAGGKLHRAIRNRNKDLSETKLLEEGDIQAAQEDGQKINVCICSLRQHVKVINRNSNALKEHTKIIEDIAAQGKDSAILVGAISRWIKLLIWTTGISFVIAVIAVLIAIFK